MGKLNPKHELMVLMSVMDLKEATLFETQTYLRDHWNTEIEKEDMERYLSRWKRAKVLSVNLVGTDWVYGARDVPWYPKDIMANIVKVDVSDIDAKEFLDNYKTEVKERITDLTKSGPKIAGYNTFDIELEATDYIAGGINGDPEDNGNDMKTLYFPKRDGKPYIPRGWLRGWIRDNARLIDQGETIKNYLGLSVGTFITPPKTEMIMANGFKGPQKHECVTPGSVFKFVLKYPMRGTMITSKDELMNYFHEIEVAPIKGIGAYERYFGGTVKLTKLEVHQPIPLTDQHD